MTQIQLVRNKIMNLERAALELPQTEIPCTHDFNGGMYARTIFIPKGTVLTGAIHTLPHLNIVHGDISIVTEEGTKRYTGYHVIPSMPGTKRVGVAHADTQWTTILKTDLTDPEEIEKQLVTTSFDDPRLPANKTLELGE